MKTRIEIKPKPDLVEVTAIGDTDQRYVQGVGRFNWYAYFDGDRIASGVCNTFVGAENAAKLAITAQLVLNDRYHGGAIITGWLPDGY